MHNKDVIVPHLAVTLYVCEEFPSPLLLNNLVQLALVQQLLFVFIHDLLLQLNSGFVFIRHIL